MKELNWTGERLVTSVTDIHGTIEHLHRYALAREVGKEKIVLDIASGEGYGSNLISQVANTVYGVDISEESIIHARKKYQKDNLKFLIGSTSKIPLPDQSVDVVVSFETLEHHDEHDQMLAEIRRVMKLGGVLIISSPEKTIYKDRDPNNPYHVKELSLNDFTSLLQQNFRNIRIFEQRFVFGSILNCTSPGSGFTFYDGTYDQITKTLQQDNFYNRPFFNVAIASDETIADMTPHTSFFNGLRVLHREQELHRQELVNLRTSISYRVGRTLIRPLANLRRLINRWLLL